MTALTKDRDTPRRAGRDYYDPVAAGKTIHAGALVALDSSGNATPGATATTLIARGVAQETVDNSAGSAGDAHVKTMAGVFRFENDGTDTCERTDIGGDAWIVDDQTVANADTGTPSRSKAGTIKDVDDDGVWVAIG